MLHDVVNLRTCFLDASVNTSCFKDVLKLIPIIKLDKCSMDGTYVDQLAIIQEWITGTQRPNIFYIHGSL